MGSPGNALESFSESVLQCLRCGFSPQEDVLECPNCKLPTSALYVAGDFCRECSLEKGDRPQTYSVFDERLGTFTFNVSDALQLTNSVNKRRLHDTMIANFLQTNVTEPRHYPHVTSKEPGLVAEIKVGNEMAYCLIDGSHRAAIALKERKPYYAYILPWAVARQCIDSFQPAIISAR